MNSRDAPDYHKLVKKPVDLLSIRRQIEDGVRAGCFFTLFLFMRWLRAYHSFNVAINIFAFDCAAECLQLLCLASFVCFTSSKRNGI